MTRTLRLCDLEAVADEALGPPKGESISARSYRLHLVLDALGSDPVVASPDQVQKIRDAAAGLGLSNEPVVEEEETFDAQT